MATASRGAATTAKARAAASVVIEGRGRSIRPATAGFTLRGRDHQSKRAVVVRMMGGACYVRHRGHRFVRAQESRN